MNVAFVVPSHGSVQLVVVGEPSALLLAFGGGRLAVCVVESDSPHGVYALE